jgi:hypothetical protein
MAVDLRSRPLRRRGGAIVRIVNQLAADRVVAVDEDDGLEFRFGV